MLNRDESYILDKPSTQIVYDPYKANDRTTAVVGCVLLEEALIDALNKRIVGGAPKSKYARRFPG